MRVVAPLIVLAAAALPAQAPRIAAAAPTLVLVGGRVFTSDPATPWAEAVAVRDSLVLRVGTRAEIERLVGPATRVLDVGGRVVIPGINDAHVHVLGAGSVVRVAVGGPQPPDPALGLVLDSVRAVAARTPPGTLLRATIGPTILNDPRARRAALDSAVPTHPVWLSAWSGHGAVLSTAALRRLGVPEDPRDPLGGFHERDATGRPTGLLHEYALWNAQQPLLAAESDSAHAAAYDAFAAQAVRFGITSAQDFVQLDSLDRVARIARLARPSIRLRLMPFVLTDEGGRRTGAWPQRAVNAGPMFTVGGVKYILDGTPVEMLAAERADYAGQPGRRGALNFPPDTLRAAMREALAQRRQPLVHAVGDSAAAALLWALDRSGAPAAWRALRPRIEHGDGLTPDLRPAARRLGAVVVQNPTHLALGPLLVQRYGEARRRVYQPLRSLLAEGIPVALGSDGPLNPFLNLMFAITHPNNPPEALTREQAVVAYTRGAAYAEHAERRKGTLAAGMLADLAVLSQDVFAVPTEALPTTTSVLTVVGGRVVHDAGVLAALPAAPRPR